MDIVCLDPGWNIRFGSQYGWLLYRLDGEYIINVLEPKRWEEDSGSVLPRHISFLRDFSCLQRLYQCGNRCAGDISGKSCTKAKGITEISTFQVAARTLCWPDLHALAERELEPIRRKKINIYTRETVRDLCLKLKSICIGADSKFLTDTQHHKQSIYLLWHKGITDADTAIRVMLFNVLSFI